MVVNSSDIVAVATKIGEIATQVDVTNADPVTVAAYIVLAIVGDGFLHGGLTGNPWARQALFYGIKAAWQFGVNAWNNRKQEGK